jgi:hypothetical protein
MEFEIQEIVELKKQIVDDARGVGEKVGIRRCRISSV